jgi:transposase
MGQALAALDARIRRLDVRLLRRAKSEELPRRLAQIPGVGPVLATMLPDKTPDPKRFRSARHFAAWLGLTPKDHSTAGKHRLGVITRAGDEDLRAGLVVGAMAIVKLAKRCDGRFAWLERLLARKSPKLAAVALANKIARTAWKMMVSGEEFDPRRFAATA